MRIAKNCTRIKSKDICITKMNRGENLEIKKKIILAKTENLEIS